jgi:signal peptidase I/conjugal transfer pilin signal peptidase TrbI
MLFWVERKNLKLQLPPRNRIAKAVAVIVACASFGMWLPSHLTVNTTASLPQRLFFLKKKVSSGDIAVGRYVQFPFQDDMTKRLVGPGEVLLVKRVGCVSGQRLTVDSEKGYWCDGQWLGKAKDRSIKGVPMTNFVWNGVVPPGKFFAVADHKDSYDSRYYGLIDERRVKAMAYPIF